MMFDGTFLFNRFGRQCPVVFVGNYVGLMKSATDSKKSFLFCTTFIFSCSESLQIVHRSLIVQRGYNSTRKWKGYTL